jgi:metal-responsive CopG/Arc/MetJ family transcriptional regulator
MPISEPKERFTVTIPASLKREVEKIVPERQRSRFTVSALEQALKEANKARAIKAVQNAPSFPTGGEDSVDVLKKVRKQRSEHLAARHNHKTS